MTTSAIITYEIITRIIISIHIGTLLNYRMAVPV